MLQPLVSIITPMYNAEKTVTKMLESVLAQDYQNIEVIVIDDDSTDGSVSIVSNLNKKYSNLKLVISDENIGPGPAKNMGMDLVKGKYFTFVDSDDWLEKNAITKMVNAALSDNSDVVVAGYNQDYLKDDDSLDYTIKVLPPALKSNIFSNDIFAELDSSKTFSFCWQKLYKTSIIREYNVAFPPMMHSEDFFFNIEYFTHVNKISIIHDAFYHYTKPKRQTLTTNDYLPGFYDLIIQRYIASRDFCIRRGCFEGYARSHIGNIHIKHMMSALSYNRSPKSGMNYFSRLMFTRKMLKDETCIEAIENSVKDSHSAVILNTIMKTKSAFVIQSFADIMWIIKNKFLWIFDKVK